MRKFVLFFMVLSIIVFPAFAEANEINVEIIGTAKWDMQFDVSPALEYGHILAPVRKVSEALDAEVIWDARTRIVIITSVNTKIMLPVGSSYAYLNGSKVELSVPTTIKKGRAIAPILFKHWMLT